MAQYDFLIVGSGLFGSVFAHEAARRGKQCLVIEKRNHIGGNVYCENVEGVSVHKYGAHIFHTNDEKIWKYVNALTPFNHYRHSVIANHHGELYSLPFNMYTFYKLWGTITPAEAMKKIKEQTEVYSAVPQNLEEQALSLVGKDIYEILIKSYTEKQWGRKAVDLPASIIKRLPFRFTYDNSYFNDSYQGIAEAGYTQLIKKLLEKATVRLNTDFFASRQQLQSMAETVVFTGMIDQYFDYRFGELEYRSLRFEHEVLETPNYQGHSVINFTDAATPFTRIIEHKHFEFGQQPNTVITREYPQEWNRGLEPYYPINDERNTKLFKKYRELAAGEKNVIFGGRLAEYRYYDMHQVIASALTTAKSVFQNANQNL